MALISGVYDDEPRKQNSNCLPGVQKYLEHLESTVRGEPGRPRAIPEPYQEPPEAMELVDGVAPVPEPEKPKRKQRKRRPVPEDFPTGDRELKLLARKLTGR